MITRHGNNCGTKKENMFSMTFSAQAEKHSVLEKCFSVVFKATFYFRVCFVGYVGEHLHRNGAVKVVPSEREKKRGGVGVVDWGV